MHKFTKDEIDYIKKNFVGTRSDVLTQLFNNHFGLNLKVSQIRAFLTNHGLRNGLDCRFKPGHKPFNKGKKGVGGWEPTQFKKGNRPHNYKPVGTERINGDGYIDIKIKDPNKWKPKHIILWEEQKGPIPKGSCLIFADGDKLNVKLENLILVTRSQLLIMNKRKLINQDPELTKTGTLIANIIDTGNKKKKKP